MVEINKADVESSLSADIKRVFKGVKFIHKRPGGAEEQVDAEKIIMNTYKKFGLFFCAPWSAPCCIWANILQTLQKEYNHSYTHQTFKIICVPLTDESDIEIKGFNDLIDGYLFPPTSKYNISHLCGLLNKTNEMPKLVIIDKNCNVLKEDGL
eukprot:CAMPEP_0176371986 /NCGR_PEP_ID=MMETSP0126-20121128/25079_1 /TAXON_ID=141414 ORGANISM="Strombidinopsis acuminatum, Strain SPMC142" /NCGR_SAMPLE_ID=MMETSP0126 /ASSEMBLY_ACC=CAM_ASM_000229 /LENGTH=152 /DNA_ID=CAMNT_0017731657 /DNA_START=11 /DNA_END=469 /DNA_ORIENTATION=+